MKKKASLSLALVMALISLTAIAFAVAGQTGILDFIGRFQGSEMPEDAGSYIQTRTDSYDMDAMTVYLRESYFDGYTARFVLDAVPKAEKTALVPDMIGLDDPAGSIPYTLYPEDGWDEEPEEEDESTVLDALTDQGFEKLYVICADVHDAADAEDSLSSDCIMHEDGSATLYWQILYNEYHASGEFAVVGLTIPVVDGEADYDQRVRQDFPFSLSAAQDDATQNANTLRYLPVDSGDLASTGTRIDSLTIHIAPQELYYTVELTVIDPEKYAATDGGLWVELIDPDSTAEEPYAQRLKDGLTGVGSSDYVDENGQHSDTPTEHLLQSGSLARSELRDSYSLRGFNCWEKNRYETVVVEKVEE